MSNTLSEMWRKYNTLFEFKKLMNTKGYVGKDVYVLEVQLRLLKELINVESKQVLNDFLIKKSYYRLLQNIEKGIEILPNVLECPEDYILNPIDKDKDAWLDNTLIFTCKSGTAVFSNINRKSEGFTYLDGKFQ